MLCNICSKKQATVHLTEIIDEEITELHLCEDCAKEKGAQMESHFGLSDLLAGLADLGGGHFSKEKNDIKIKCSKCGLTYEDFKKVGRLGCGECYSSFKDALLPLLKRIHGSTQHSGKIPKSAPKPSKAQNSLQELKDKLQEAVRLEKFEEAAGIRDKIKELEKKKKQEKQKNSK